MQIPKRFRLLGQVIDVEISDTVLDERNCHGEAHYRTGKIMLENIKLNPGRKSSHIEATFCHEMVHFLAYHAGAAVNHELKEPLHRNEEFVDLFGQLLHQALITMEYK